MIILLIVPIIGIAALVSIEVPNLKNFALPTQPHTSTARRLP